MKETHGLQQKCLEQLNSGLTKDLEAAYMQALALLRIADRLDELVERQHAEEVKQKATKSKS